MPDLEPRPLDGMEVLDRNAALGSFHTTSPEDRAPNNTGKVIGALAVALMVGAAGVYVYSVSTPAPKPKITVAQLPNTPPPAKVAETAPPPSMTVPAETPSANAIDDQPGSDQSGNGGGQGRSTKKVRLGREQACPWRAQRCLRRHGRPHEGVRRPAHDRHAAARSGDAAGTGQRAACHRFGGAGPQSDAARPRRGNAQRGSARRSAGYAVHTGPDAFFGSGACGEPGTAAAVIAVDAKPPSGLLMRRGAVSACP